MVRRWRATGPLTRDRRSRLRAVIAAVPFRSAAFVIIIGLLAGAAGALVALRRAHVYTSTAVLLIDQPGAAVRSQDDGPLRKLTLLKLKYAGLAAAPQIAGAAAASVGSTAREVAKSITVTVPFSSTGPSPSFVLLVTAQSEVADHVQQTADAEADAMALYAGEELAKIGVSPGDRYELSVTRRASPAALAQPNRKVSEQAAFGFGVLGALGAYAILQLVTAGAAGVSRIATAAAPARTRAS
jgi:hypothetical protein